MKKSVLAIALLSFLISPAHAQKVSYIDEVEALGIISGQGLACDASKYHTFELLARAILISKATSDEMQERGMTTYNEAKAKTFISKIKDGLS